MTMKCELSILLTRVHSYAIISIILQAFHLSAYFALICSFMYNVDRVNIALHFYA